MYLIALNQFLDPVIVWLDEPPDPTSACSSEQHVLALRTYEEACDIAGHVLQLLDEGREAALLFQPSLVT
jgi:hypothetical protein